MATKIVVGADGSVRVVDLTPEEEVQRLADQAKYTAKSEAAAVETIRSSGIRDDAGRVDLLNRLKTATSTQIDTWVDNNVTTLAAARTVLKAIIKVIALDQRQ